MRGFGRRNALLVCGLIAAGATGSGLTSPGAARADISPDQAAALQAQIRGWLAALLGPNVPLGDNPVLVTAEGDHYRLSLPIAGQYGDAVKVTGDAATVLVKPLDANRWAIDEMRMPSPVKVENTGAGGDMFKSWTAKIAEQTATGTIDLSMATTSTIDQTLRGYSTVTENAMGEKTSHVDRTTSRTTITPAGDGRVNMVVDGGGEHLASDSAMPDGSAIKVTADSFKLTGRMDRVSAAQLGAAIKIGTGMIPLIQQASADAKATTAKEKQKPDQDAVASKDGAKIIPKKDDDDDDDDDASAKPATPLASSAAPSPAKPAQTVPVAMRGPLHDFVRAMSDALGGFEEKIAMEKFKIQSDAFAASIAHLSTGVGFGVPDGKLDMHMIFTMDGIESAMIPPGIYRDYVPRHFSMTPRISGVPSADVTTLLDHAIDSDGSDASNGALQMEALGLLAKGPLSLGIDDLSFEMGPAALKSTGSVLIASPADYTGKAKISVTGFDKLIQQSNTNPQLKQAAPVLIFLKGIGQPEGAGMVWNILYQDKQLLVNGTNMSNMMPGAQPGK